MDGSYSAAIIERSQDLQMAFFHKCQEHHEPIAKMLSANIWDAVQRAEIDHKVNKAIDDALD